jgi:hypothetical protein
VWAILLVAIDGRLHRRGRARAARKLRRGALALAVIQPVVAVLASDIAPFMIHAGIPHLDSRLGGTGTDDGLGCSAAC